MRRIHRLALGGESAALLAAIVLGSVALWVGAPVGWLWIGSQLQAKTGSVGYALLAMMFGLTATLALLAFLLGRLNRRHVELKAARGLDVSGSTALEQVLVASAALALIGFAVWFFGFSGSEPIPMKLGY